MADKFRRNNHPGKTHDETLTAMMAEIKELQIERCKEYLVTDIMTMRNKYHIKPKLTEMEKHQKAENLKI